MPKTTVHGGASNRQAEPRSNDEYSRPSPVVVEQEADAAELEPRVQTLEDPYDSWTRKELQAELRKRGLPVSGTKDEQVARLKANEPQED